MGYIKGYKYDIFISYSHLDNLKIFDETRGWIEEFYNDLNILLSRRIGNTDAIKFWMDKRKLDGTVVFDQSIRESVTQSAIMICLTSPGYLASPYCKKELEMFYGKVKDEPLGLAPGNRCRIINVLLNNIPYTEWPKELSGTTGFPFHDATEKDDYGDTFELSRSEFKDQMKELKDAIIKLIGEFPANNGSGHAIPQPFTIYFGDVAESLRAAKEKAITDLEKEGYNIICDIPPPFEEAAHEKAVTEKLKEIDLSVHLMDHNAGTLIDGPNTIWYPQRQAELSLLTPKPQLIWAPAGFSNELAKEKKYKAFIKDLESGRQSSKKIEFIKGPRAELSRQIKEFAQQLKNQPPPVQPDHKKLSVLLDTHYSDQNYALELTKCLVKNQIQPFINPQDDDPLKNLKILEKRISQVTSLIFFYGKVTGDWVTERIKAAKQLIVLNDYPIEDFFVYMLPPHKDPDDSRFKQRFFKINLVNNSDADQLDAGALDSLLKGIRHEFE